MLRWYRARPSSSTRSLLYTSPMLTACPETPMARPTLTMASVAWFFTNIPYVPKALASLGGIFAGSHQPTHTPLAARTCRQCANTHFAIRNPKVGDGFLPFIQADRSHRYGYAKAVLGLFPCGQWTEDSPPLHLRLSALVSLNSRGMVTVTDLHCAATDSCTARVNASSRCVRRDRPIGLQGSWRAAKKPASPRCGHYARTCPITAQSP